ncbi:MAG: DUF4881 domain-containing protein [bacterium]|nr:DUF4881 domain-containing protein [bacterium]
MCSRVRGAVPLLIAALLAGCGLGTVEQGIVIGYDEAKAEITVIHDSNAQDPQDPHYDVLPPVTVRLPTDPDQMGPEPEAGKLISIDAGSSRAIVYNAASGQIETIPIEVSETESNVYPDDSRVSGANRPTVDNARGLITAYSPRTRQIVTFTPPPELLSLPRDTWKAGDEVRYYFKDPSQALRMMNVTKTKVS